MRRLIFIGIAVFLLQALHAQTDSLMMYNLSGVVVKSSSIQPQVFSKANRIVQVIEAEEIQQMPVQSIEEMLEFTVSADVRQRGIHGVQADVSIRGGTFDQTLVLINGVPVNDPQTGHHNLNIPIDLSQVARVEILEGPASRVFGVNAFSGAINIITHDGKNDAVKLNVATGQHSFYNTGASFSKSNQVLSSFIALSSKGSEGYTDNTDFFQYQLYGNQSVGFGANVLSAQYGLQNKQFGANSFYTASYPEQFEQTRSVFGSLNFSHIGSVNIDAIASWRRHHDRFELFREDRYKRVGDYFVKGDSDTAKYAPAVYEAWSYYPGHNYHMTDVVYTNIKAGKEYKYGVINAGVNYTYDQIFSNVLGNSLEEPIDVVGEDFGKFTKSATRNNLSLFFENISEFGKFDLSFGGMFNENSTFGSNYAYGAESSYWMSDKLKVFVSVNQSFRMPTYTDLYYSGPSNVGNPELEIEEAFTYEGGMKYFTNSMYMHVAGFFRDSKNLIDWVKSETDDRFTTMNHTQVETYGVEFQLKRSVGKHNADFSYAFMNSKKYDGELISAYTLDYLKHKAVVKLNLSIVNSFKAQISVSFQDRFGTYTASEGEVDYDPFMLLNSRLIYYKDKFDIYLEGSNLLDVKYRDLGTVEMPGRWFIMGVNVKLDI